MRLSAASGDPAREHGGPPRNVTEVAPSNAAGPTPSTAAGPTAHHRRRADAHHRVAGADPRVGPKGYFTDAFAAPVVLLTSVGDRLDLTERRWLSRICVESLLIAICSPQYRH